MDVVLAARDDDAAEGPWALPEGWCWTTLENVADGPQYGWTASAAATGKVRLLRTTDISSGSVNWATVPFCTESPADVEKYLLRDGDIVISRAGSVGKSFQISRPLRAVFASYLIRFHPRIDGKYLHYFLQTGAYWAQIQEKSAGIAIPNVNGSKLKSIRLCLAPLPEQHRIVTRVDELFAEIAEGEAALAAARKGIDAFRRALLKAAVTGELTKDWRATNSASATSHDILERLRKLYPNASPTRDGWKPKSNLPPLPDGWTWCAIEEAGAVQLGRQRAPQHHDGDNMRPYLRVANIHEDRLDLSDVKWMNFTPTEFKTFELRYGDILLNEGQAPDLLGRPAMYRGEIVDCCFQKTLLRFRAKEGVLPDFALIVFRYYMRSGRFKRESRITTNIGHLTQVRFVVMEFPLPPEPEQRAIVESFRNAEAAVTDVLTLLDAEAADAARLKQSILKAAFEGRLVPQDPAEEPASALLARIAANPSAVPAKRGRVRKSAV